MFLHFNSQNMMYLAPQCRVNLLLCFVTNRTGVINQHICFSWIICITVANVFQDTCHPLRVSKVHLSPKQQIRMLMRCCLNLEYHNTLWPSFSCLRSTKKTSTILPQSEREQLLSARVCDRHLTSEGMDVIFLVPWIRFQYLAPPLHYTACYKKSQSDSSYSKFTLKNTETILSKLQCSIKPLQEHLSTDPITTHLSSKTYTSQNK